MSSVVITFNHLESDTWSKNNTTQVNPIPFDYLAPPALATGSMAGSLAMSAAWSQNYAGGLYSIDIPATQYESPRKLLYGALNVVMCRPSLPDDPFARIELDLKWTLPGGLQINGSTQIKVVTTRSWQLDPTGSAWVDSGCLVTTDKPGQWNLYQIRLSTDGATVWSVTGLQCNQEPAFIPGSAFQNIPLIQTTWTAGLHPQIQWEGVAAPNAATVWYRRVQLAVSDQPIPMLDASA